MTIALAAPASKPKAAPSSATTGNDAVPSKVKSGAADSAQSDSKLPGFSSVLASLEDSAPTAAPVVDASDAENISTHLDTKTDKSGSVAPVVAPPDPTTVLAQALQWLSNAAGIVAPQAATESTKATQVVQATPLSGQVALTTKGTDVPVVAKGGQPAVLDTPGKALTAPHKPASAVGEVVLADAGTTANVQTTAANGVGGSPHKSAKNANEAVSAQSVAMSRSGIPMADGGRTDSKMANPLDQQALLQSQTLKTEPALQVALATVKHDEQQSVHGAAKSNAAMDVATSWNPAASLSASPMAAAGGTAAVSDTSALTPAFVAEQVSYWISNDVQSAEMKLQGLGEAPVEVRISMVGNEAHVVFRTDEAHARDALENASAHLKEMLQRDGVVLAGVSVGTSGSGSSGGSDAQHRPGAQHGRQNVAIADPKVQHEARPWGKAQAGRTLDLFV